MAAREGMDGIEDEWGHQPASQSAKSIINHTTELPPKTECIGMWDAGIL